MFIFTPAPDRLNITLHLLQFSECTLKLHAFTVCSHQRHYMNSVLQTTFHINVRNNFYWKIYQTPFKLLRLLMSEFNSTRNAFDFAYLKSVKGGFFEFYIFRNTNIPYLRRKGYICIFFITCLLNFDNNKLFALSKKKVLFATVRSTGAVRVRYYVCNIFNSELVNWS